MKIKKNKSFANVHSFNWTILNKNKLLITMVAVVVLFRI